MHANAHLSEKPSWSEDLNIQETFVALFYIEHATLYKSIVLCPIMPFTTLSRCRLSCGDGRIVGSSRNQKYTLSLVLHHASLTFFLHASLDTAAVEVFVL